MNPLLIHQSFTAVILFSSKTTAATKWIIDLLEVVLWEWEFKYFGNEKNISIFSILMYQSTKGSLVLLLQTQQQLFKSIEEIAYNTPENSGSVKVLVKLIYDSLSSHQFERK